MRAPTLTTERLVLREHRLDDFDALTAMWADPEVVRFIGGKPVKPEDVWMKLLRSVGHWAMLGFGYWVVCSRDGAFLGEVGFADFHRHIEPSIHGLPEMGWALVPTAHGKGLGSEAIRAALDWAPARFEQRRVVCIVDEDNQRSRHVAQKCGFTPWCQTRYHDVPTVMMEKRW